MFLPLNLDVFFNLTEGGKQCFLLPTNKHFFAFFGSVKCFLSLNQHALFNLWTFLLSLRSCHLFLLLNIWCKWNHYPNILKHRVTPKHASISCGFVCFSHFHIISWGTNWMSLMWFAPNIFENCLIGTFRHASTVSLLLFLKSTLSQGHLPLCATHTHNTPL